MYELRAHLQRTWWKIVAMLVGSPARLTSRILPIVVSLSLMGLLTGAVVPAVAAYPTVTRSYQTSNAQMANPDRGLYHYTETHYRADGSGYTPLNLAQLQQWRTADGVTVVYRIFYLEKFVNQPVLDPKYLRLVATDFATAEAAGVKLIVRFAYTATSSADAALPIVLAHIRQLAPIIDRFSPVIATLQAGFIGQWGEWYYTQHFAHDQQQPWNLNNADWAARGQVLTALLDATPPSLFVQVRYPAIKQRLLEQTGNPAAKRVGIHDDCFLASPTDYGTFNAPGDRRWLAAETQTVPMGGETCNVDPPRSQWPSAATDLARYHWSFLNADYQQAVLSSWGAGLAVAQQRLGYRLALTQATLPTRAAVGHDVNLQLTFNNSGYAAPLGPRPVQLVLHSATRTTVMNLPLNAQQFSPGSHTVNAQVRVAASPGVYQLYLALPDPSPVLAGRPAYSIQLADQGGWDAGHGWNNLQTTLTVTR